MDEAVDTEAGVEPEGEHKRADPRDSLFLQAQMTRADHPPVTLRVRNLSSGGLMADCTVPTVRGESIEVEIRGIGPVTGKIAWVHNGRIGIAFDVRVDPKLARKPVTGAGSAKPPLLTLPPVAARRPGLRID